MNVTINGEYPSRGIPNFTINLISSTGSKQINYKVIDYSTKQGGGNPSPITPATNNNRNTFSIVLPFILISLFILSFIIFMAFKM